MVGPVGPVGLGSQPLQLGPQLEGGEVELGGEAGRADLGVDDVVLVGQHDGGLVGIGELGLEGADPEVEHLQAGDDDVDVVDDRRADGLGDGWALVGEQAFAGWAASQDPHGPSRYGRRRVGMGMVDDELIARIHALVDEEHQLHRDAPAEHERLDAIEVELDQCWDLLRQRRARRRAGQDPGDAHARDARTVEGYQQ